MKIRDVPRCQRKTPPRCTLFTVWNQENWHIFEYKDALPRVFLSSSYKVETDRQKILDTIFAQEPTGTTLVLEEQPSVKNADMNIGSAQIERYTPNSVTVRVVPTNDGLLFLSDTHFPGWNAYVDGKKSKVYRANYAFRAAAVPAGSKRVEFRYEPDSFRWGMGITVLSIMTTALLSLRFKKKDVS